MILAILAAATVAAAPPPITYEVYGIGQGSCATWLASASNESQGNQWSLGFWSALNLNNERNKFVGTQTDGYGILGEIKKECLASPSTFLVNAVVDVYSRMVPAR